VRHQACELEVRQTLDELGKIYAFRWRLDTSPAEPGVAIDEEACRRGAGPER
jgi:hypothetical protein